MNLYLMHQLLNKKSVIIFALCSLLYFPIQAQECGTEELSDQEMEQLPWFGNPDYLYNFLDSIQLSNSTARIEPDIRFKVPIRFWILRGEISNPSDLLDDGERFDLPQEEDLQRLIDAANDGWRNADRTTGMRFYMVAPQMVTVPNPAMSATGIARLLLTTPGFISDDFSLNVIIRSDGDMPYFTPFGNYIVLNRSVYTSNTNAKTFPHELGHFFGLAHTHRRHEIPCFREPVSRGNVADATCLLIGNFNPFKARCSYTGDALCDTEADPNMSWSGRYNTATCTYTGTVRDYRGDIYRPLPHNYMAYGNGGCSTQFTEQQVGVILYTALTKSVRCPKRWREEQPENIFDIYEPNNTISGATNVTRLNADGTVQNEGLVGRIGLDNVLRPEISQTHSFHKVPIDIFVNELLHWDNFDYIPIEAPRLGFDILTGYSIKVSGDVNLIQDIELFTATEVNGRTIEQPTNNVMTIDNTSSENIIRLFIPCDVINAITPIGERVQYYLRVRRNTSTNTTGIYNLNMEEIYKPEITGSSLICKGTSIEQTIDVDSDYTVTWSQQEVRDGENINDPNGFISLFPTSPNTVTLNASIESGRYFLRAEVVNNKTGCSTRVDKVIRIGRVPEAAIRVETVNLNSQNEVCPNSSFLIRFDLDTINFPLVSFDSQELISTNPEFIIGSPSAFGYIQVRSASTFHQSTTIVYRVTNECGTTEIRTVVHTPHESNKSLNCREGGEKPIIGVYPNPTEDFIDIDILCECIGIEVLDVIDPTDPAKYSISRVDISDIFGITRLSYQGSQIPINSDGNIRLNLSQLPAGNYVLKLIMQNKVYIKHVIKQ